MTLSMIIVSALTCIAMDFLNGTFPELKPHPRTVAHQEGSK